MDAIAQLEAHFLEILDLMPNEFDSHDFISKLAHENEKLYISALAQHIDSSYPVRTTNSKLATRLSQGGYQVEKQGSVRSPNLFGDKTECEKWRKL